MQASKTATQNSGQLYWSIFAMGTVLRLLALVFGYHAPLASDAVDYSAMARQLYSGVHFLPYWPPGVPLFLLPFVAVGFSDAALRIPMLLFWACAAWGLLRLCRALNLEKFAWILLLIASITPASIQMSLEPMTQMPTAALVLVALSAAVLCLQGAGLGEYLLLGFSLGFLFLVRPSTGLLLVFLPGIVLLRTKRWTPILLAWIFALACIAGWCAKAHQLSGAWVVNIASGKNLWYGNNAWTPNYRTWFFGSHAKSGTAEILQYPEYGQALAKVEALPLIARSAVFQSMAKDYIRQHPGTFLLRTANRIRCYWGYDTFTATAVHSSGKILFGLTLLLEAGLYVLLIGTSFFFIASAGRSFWRRWDVWLLCGAILLYAAPYWVSMSHPTYHFPVVLPVAVLGAIAWQSRGEQSSGKLRGWLAVAIFLLIQIEWTLQMARSV